MGDVLIRLGLDAGDAVVVAAKVCVCAEEIEIAGTGVVAAVALFCAERVEIEGWVVDEEELACAEGDNGRTDDVPGT
jgi:hypothetical protein